MKNAKTRLALAAFAAAVTWLAGCATPEVRIRKHPEIVRELPPDQLSLIKDGKVEEGFDMDMVRLALGEPDHVKIRPQKDGSNEVWMYSTYETKDGRPLYRGLYHRYYLTGDASHPFYLNDSLRREHERFRVVFKDEKVVAIEKENENPTLARLK